MSHDVVGPLLLLVGIILYFLPAGNAYSRGHHQAGPILVINFFLGWTFVGWVCALAWSMTAIPSERY